MIPLAPSHWDFFQGIGALNKNRWTRVWYHPTIETLVHGITWSIAPCSLCKIMDYPRSLQPKSFLWIPWEYQCGQEECVGFSGEYLLKYWRTKSTPAPPGRGSYSFSHSILSPTPALDEEPWCWIKWYPHRFHTGNTSPDQCYLLKILFRTRNANPLSLRRSMQFCLALFGLWSPNIMSRAAAECPWNFMQRVAHAWPANTSMKSYAWGNKGSGFLPAWIQQLMGTSIITYIWHICSLGVHACMSMHVLIGCGMPVLCSQQFYIDMVRARTCQTLASSKSGMAGFRARRTTQARSTCRGRSHDACLIYI